MILYREAWTNGKRTVSLIRDIEDAVKKGHTRLSHKQEAGALFKRAKVVLKPKKVTTP